MSPARPPSRLTRSPSDGAQLAPRLIAIAIAGAFSSTYSVPVKALPTGAQVAAGQAVITKPQANVLNIQSTPNAIINWQQFNIGASESVRIQQQNAASAILNRVVGGEASKILGQLSSNGRVFLINPSGIVFGQGARIDTAGFIASSLNITDANFLAGKLTFEGTHKNGIKNEGTIRSLGEIVLIAPKIENSGILQTEGGDIVLAAGQKVTITNLANPEVLVEIKAPDNEVVNLGRILSNGGAISILANRLKHSGEINATRAEVGPGGRITLRGDDELTITPDAKVISNGSPAGQITLQSANGTTTVEGTIEARGTAPTPAQVTSNTRGGRIEVLGQQVTLASTAIVDASGERGGGAVYIGGDYQGGSAPLPERWAVNPATQPYPASTSSVAARAETLLTAPVQSAPVMTAAPPASPADQSGSGVVADQPLLPPVRNPLQNSRTTTIASGARVRADAKGEGDGGTIIVWSEESTRVYGSLSARGGASGGNGGFAETSGRRALDVGAIPPDLGASKGLAGQWLLDPNNITIQATGSDTNISGSPNFVSTADGAIITVATIKAALDAGTSVTISTSSGGAQLGDITINNAIATSSATDVTLTLNAHNNININASLSATGTGKLNLVLNANTDATGGGAASLNSGGSLVLKGGTISSANGSALTVVTGTLDNVTLSTNLQTSNQIYLQNGLTLNGATLTVNGGSINYNGTQAIGGTGSLVFAGSGTGYLYRQTAGTTLTIGSGVTVSGSGTGGAYIGYYSDEAINFQGTLNANAAGKNWYLGSLANTGNINVSAGAVHLDTISGVGSWTNTATVGKGIAVSGGVLNLGDAFNASSLGNIVQTGGTVNLTGTMTLNQASTNLSTVGLTSFVVTGGSAQIIGGGNTLTSNGTLALSTAAGATLNNVVLATNLSVTGVTYLTNGLTLATNATTLNPATVTLGNGGDLRYDGTQTLGGTGNLVFGGTSTTWLYRQTAGSALTIGSGITVSGSGTGNVYFGYYADDAINFQGVLNADVSGKAWFLGNVANTGNINISAGTLYLDTASGVGSWTNTATGGKGIAISGGVLNLGDAFNASTLGNIAQTGGTVNLTGTMTLNQASTNLSTAGLTALVIDGGTVVGGGNTLTSNGSLALSSVSGSTLNNVTLATDLSITGLTYLTNGLTLATNATTLNPATVTLGNGGDIRYNGTQTLGGTGSLIFGGTSTTWLYRQAGGTTLTIGPGITVSGSGTGSVYLGYYSDEAINFQGVLNASVAGKTWYLGNVANTGNINISAGTVHLDTASGVGESPRLQ